MIDYTPDTPWPPQQLADVRSLMLEWDAWYDGTRLDSYYGASLSTGSVLPHVRPSQYAGGVVGTMSRLWWGNPPTDGTGSNRPKYHVPIASDIAVAAADLLFGDELNMRYFEGDDAAHEQLAKILDDNNLAGVLVEAAETQSKDGGVYLRITTDPVIGDGAPIISSVSAEAAIPVFRWGRLMSVQFFHVIATKGSAIWRHVEEWTPEGVEHALFEGGADRIGRRIPLTERPETADITVDANSMVPMPGMCAFYIPNIKPGIKGHPDLGRADFARCIPQMDALDRTFTHWMRDLDAAKGRILASRDLLESRGPGKGADLDIDRDVFVPVNAPVSVAEGGGLPINVVQFQMDVQRYEATFSAILELILRSSGFSPATFGVGAVTGQRTATEIKALQARSDATREKKTRYWTNAIESLIDQVARVAGLGEAMTAVSFPTEAQVSQLELAQTALALRSAKAASTETLVKITQPDLSDELVALEVQRIMDEEAAQAPALADPLAVGNSLVDPALAGPTMADTASPQPKG